MRISDWSSDVCSSDLITGTRVDMQFLYRQEIALTTIMFMEIWNWTPFSFIIMLAGLVSLPREPQAAAQILGASRRSEERRVGKECVSTCRSRRSQYH